MIDRALFSRLELAAKTLSGVEISVTWRGATVHIVGLGIDPANCELNAGLASVSSGRVERARAMAAGLSAAGIPASFEGAMRFAQNPAMISAQSKL